MPLVMAAALIGPGAGAASAAACVNWTGVQPPNPSSSINVLSGMAALSSCRAWAVGHYFNGTASQTLIERWNGSSWAQQSSPNPGGSTRTNALHGVTATSSSNAWAVGYYSNGTATQTLIEHWNGSIWAQEPSPSPGSSANALVGVAATSASNAWAVGYYHNGTAYQTLIERWNGTRWTRVSSPNPGGSTHTNELTDVAATSASNAWAVGDYYNGTAYQTLTERWNGTAWKKVSSPNPGGPTRNTQLVGVAATSASNAWAVGSYYNGVADQTLTERWNGTAWTRVSSPNPGPSDNLLQGVAATSASNAWAVGHYFNGAAYQTLIAHWNGSIWAQEPSPNPSSSVNTLAGVAATSASNAWAVGYYQNGTAYQTLALHCC